MNQSTSKKSVSKRFTPVGIIFAVLGLLLFAYFIWKANPALIWENLKQLGAGFLLVLLISGARPVVRALAWTRCFEGQHKLPFADALRAYLIGDAVGTLVPLGIFVSEPAKAALVRERVPLVASLSALAIENLFYSLSVALFIFSGTVALLLSFQLPKPLQIASISALVAVVLIIALAYFVIRKQWKFLSGLLEFLYGRGIGQKFLETKRERVRSLEDRVYGFYARNRARFIPILLLEACFHLSGVAEVYTVLYFISDSPTLLTAFILESVNRVINVVFKFVPLRMGVDEAGTGMLTKVLKQGTAVGVTLAIVRKARIICWTAVGVALLVRRGLTLRAIARGAEEAAQEASAPQTSSTVSVSELR
ncbi:MAG: flippase-like domain-containing protein [Pyrinomonadaceae bacterium]|nr:flippase-like domain-containing protein [Pyrinomonadaceae bacterium]